jgi:hypothetical protein
MDLPKQKLELVDGGEQAPDIQPEPVLRPVDFEYLSGLGHIAGNPFYKDPELPDDAA